MANEMVVREEVSVNELKQTAQLLALSGFFETKGNTEQAVAQLATKILAGREMGFGPYASVNGIHIIQGKPTVSANLMAAAVKSSGRYDYRVRKMDDDAVSLEFFQVAGGKLESLGISTFTKADATKAGTQNLAKFARNMLFARAMSNGVRWYCPDVFMSGSVYTPEEMGATVDAETGEIIEAEVKPANPLAADINFKPERDERLFKRMHATGKEIMGEAWRNGEGRELLKHVTGKESTKDLSNEEMSAVIAQLETMRVEEEVSDAEVFSTMTA
jgi:hypothetical protein